MSSTTASTIVRAEGNKSVGSQFHLFQLFWPSGPISAIVSLSCHGKVAVASGTIPPQSRNTHTHTHLTSGQRVGTSVGTTHNAFSFSMYVQLPVHVQWEMFDFPKRKRGYISSLTSQHDALNNSKKSSHSSRSPCQHTSYIIRMACLLLDL